MHNKQKIECLLKEESLHTLCTRAEDMFSSEVFSKKCAVFDIDDTLISEHSYPIKEVILLLQFFKTHSCPIALVTARHSSMRKITIDELKGAQVVLGRDYKPEDLFFCPDAYRKDFVKISEWKQSARKFLSLKYGGILCTVGDQWTDLIKIKEDNDRYRLDKSHNTQMFPYLLFRLYDGISSYGIKLKSDPIVSPKFVMIHVGDSDLQTKIIFKE